MTEKNDIRMLSIRQIAATGLISEHALRLLVKQNKVPVLYVGKKVLINYRLLENVLNREEVIVVESK